MKCQERKELAKSGLLQWMQAEKVVREKRLRKEKNIILFTILVKKKSRKGLDRFDCPLLFMAHMHICFMACSIIKKYIFDVWAHALS